MANIRKEVVTKEYYEQLQAQYRHLIDVERPQVLEELATARAQGDLSENADYDAARNKQAIIEGQIRDLEFTLGNIEVADVKASKNKITATSTVVVYDYADEEEYTYQLVGSIGSDPASGKITTIVIGGYFYETNYSSDFFSFCSNYWDELCNLS